VWEGKMINDLAIDIYKERMEVSMRMVKDLIKEHNLELSHYEILDIATRICSSLFIDKTKSLRFMKIQR